MSALSLILFLFGSAADTVQTPQRECLPKAAGLDDFRYEWYCKHLRAFGETELSAGAESYRFLYLRTFDQPIRVRVQRIGDRWLLSAAVLSGKGGYEPGRVVHTVARELSGPEVEELQRRLRGADFWGEPWVDVKDTGVDGAQWIFEGRRGDNYRLLDLWSPQGLHYRLFRELCLYFLDLAQVRPAETY